MSRSTGGSGALDRRPGRTLRRRVAVGVGVLLLSSCGVGGPVEEPPPAAPTATTPPPSTPTPGTSPTPTTTHGTQPPGVLEVTAEVTEIATGLDSPWGLAFLPDDTALVTSRDTAVILRVGPDGAVEPMAGAGPRDLAQGVRHGGEGGLLGLAVLDRTGEGSDDDVSVDSLVADVWVYVYLTRADGNAVVRMQLEPGGTLGPAQDVLSGIPAAGNHNGGQVAFGPDGMLYVSTGDAADRPSSQDPDSLAGKVLRLTPEGAPAPGNPVAGSPVWTLGHRNVQGLGWDAAGRLWASEFGQNTWDEVNLLEAGADYGWPEVEGLGGGDDVRDPVVTWAPADASPSGLAVTQEAVYVAGLRGQVLWRLPLRPGPDVVGPPQALLRGEHGRLRTVAAAPDGSLWVVTNNTDGRGSPRAGDDRILRVEVRPAG